MYGPPKPVEGCCNAHLYIGDDYGDNSATMQCGLPEGHDGAHKEIFKRSDTDVVITWEVDERPRCTHCDSVSAVETVYDYRARPIPEEPDYVGAYVKMCRSCCEQKHPYLNFDDPYYDPEYDDEYEAEEETSD